jgi:hypothetical protein
MDILNTDNHITLFKVLLCVSPVGPMFILCIFLIKYFYFFTDLHGAIGIKAYSPGQDGKRSLKVKSFVPEQYSDLVAKSARY